MSNFTTWRSLVDGEEVDGIPDSVVEQFDAQSAFSGLSDGSSISEWEGELGKWTLTGGDPTLDVSAINGYRAPVFDGTDDRLNTGQFSSSDSFEQPYTVFAVVDRTAGRGVQWTEYSDSNRRFIHFNNEWGMGTDNTNQDGSTDDTVQLISAGFDSDGYLREDGTETDSGDASDGIFEGVSLGARQPDDDLHWEGAIGFYEVHDALLTGSDLTDREQDIADMWDITL